MHASVRTGPLSGALASCVSGAASVVAVTDALLHPKRKTRTPLLMCSRPESTSHAAPVHGDFGPGVRRLTGPQGSAVISRLTLVEARETIAGRARNLRGVRASRNVRHRA